MDLKQMLNDCALLTNREKSNMFFWAFWSYAKNQKNKVIKNQLIYECYCLVNNYMSEWDKKYENFYNRFLDLSVNEFGELKIGEDKPIFNETENEEKKNKVSLTLEKIGKILGDLK